MEDEECGCAPISYVYGGVSLNPKPPGPFLVGVRVSVGTQVAPLIGPEMGHDYAIWHFFVVVKPGPTKLLCTVGDVTLTKSIETKAGETSIVNFCYGKPVISSTAKGLPKMRVRRKEAEKPHVSSSSSTTTTGRDGLATVS